MTYSESAALMTEVEFRGRVKVACIKFADSIFIEDPGVPDHETRLAWARNTFNQPDYVAGQTQPPVVMDAAVQTAGIDAQGKSLVTDAALQSAVEVTVAKVL